MPAAPALIWRCSNELLRTLDDHQYRRLIELYIIEPVGENAVESGVFSCHDDSGARAGASGTADFH